MNLDPMWNTLQEPSRPSRFPAGYMLLLSAVDTGWSISEPVVVQPTAHSSESCSYAFLLTHDNSTSLLQLVVPHSPDVEVFIRSEGLAVVEDCYLQVVGSR